MSTHVPPGPKSALFGVDFAQEFKKDPLGTATSLHRKYGDVVYVKLGPIDYFMVFHPDHAKEILVTRQKEFGKSELFKRVLRSVDGNGLVASEGDFWLKQRHTIQPTFAHNKLSEYAKTIINKTETQLAKWQSGGEINIVDAMTNITLCVAAKIFLGVDAEGREQRIGDAVSTLSHVMFREFTDVVPIPDWVPTPSKIQKRQAIAVLDELCHEGMQREKESPTPGTMLNALFATKAMPEEQVLSEAKTMFNAGHDTTAATLSWCWYNLIKHPSAYDRVAAEADAVASQLKETDGISWLQVAPFTLQVIKETLRLYPPAWSLPRQAVHATTLGDYDIPEGAYVNLFPFVTQRDPRFFDDPNTFRPERFTEENEHNLYPFAWIPFGAGPRGCIGKEFALLEMHLVLLLLAKRFRLNFAPDQGEVEMLPMVSLEPRGGIKVRIDVRN